MTELAPDFAQRWISLTVSTLKDSVERLGELDRRAGDGDFGTNVSLAMKLTEKNIAADSPTDYYSWVYTISRGYLGVGGTSGPLFGMFFRDLSKAGEGKTVAVHDFALALGKALETNQHYGGAQVGEKTMVDALAPAAEVARGLSEDAGLEALTQIAEAARQGALSTQDITASKGRASYVGEHARGVIDPGAVALALVLMAAAAASSGEQTVDTGWF